MRLCKQTSLLCSKKVVSLKSVPYKILERIIRDQMMSYLYENDLITKHQHGFVRNKACLTNILESFDMWTNTISEKQALYVVFLDYAKAFGKVSHKMLLYKLESYGIEGSLMNG